MTGLRTYQAAVQDVLDVGSKTEVKHFFALA
jgi:hypothetical protein